MKIMFNIVFVVLIFLLGCWSVGHLQITLHPFSVSMPYWNRLLGMIIVCIGVGIYTQGEYSRGKLDGEKETIDKLMNLIEDDGQNEKLL